MKGFLIAGVITVILWGGENLLCTKLKSPLWGGIIPLLTIAFTIWCFASGKISSDHTSFFVFFVLNAMMIESWISGREKRKKNQKAELEKMKAHDMNDLN